MSDNRLELNNKYLEQILSDIFNIPSPKIDEARRSEIHTFIETTINGDSTQKSLVISATLDKDKQGILVYVLTNLRLIKIEIDADLRVKSSSFFLNTMIGVEREMIEDGRTRISINFQSGSVGLRYSTTSKNITDFFQQVESQDKKGAS